MVVKLLLDLKIEYNIITVKLLLAYTYVLAVFCYILDERIVYKKGVTYDTARTVTLFG